MIDSEEKEECKCTETSLTYEERNAIKYAAGYVIRNLRKKLKRSAHPLKDELLQLLDDLVTSDNADDFSELEGSSSDWLMLINRGGLIHVNEMMYQTLVYMELELRPLLKEKCQDYTRHGVTIKSTVEKLCKNENVLFHWNLMSGIWDAESEVAKTLLHMVAELWLTMREFSHVSAWIEKHKQAAKQNLQKSKGVRKKLIT